MVEIFVSEELVLWTESLAKIGGSSSNMFVCGFACDGKKENSICNLMFDIHKVLKFEVAFWQL